MKSTSQPNRRRTGGPSHDWRPQPAGFVWRVAAAFAALVAAAPLTAHAFEYTWLGGDGSWTAGANWDLLAVPNGANSNVSIDGGKAATSNVLLNTAVGIGSLTVDAGDALNVQNTFLYIYGHQLRIDGQLNFSNVPYNTTGLRVSTDSVAFSGSGQALFTNSNLQSYYSTPAVTVAAGHTLRGAGLTVGPNINVINQGVVRAEGAGGISLLTEDRSAAVPGFDNRGGVVEVADGSVLEIGRGTLLGGTLRGQGSAALYGGLLRDAKLEGNLLVPYSSALVVGGTLANAGTLTLAVSSTGGYGGTVQLATDLTLSGAGQTVLAGGSAGFHAVCCSTLTLTVGADHTLRGNGLLTSGVHLVNQGHLVAEGGALISQYSLVDNLGKLDVAAGATFGNSGITLTLRQTAPGASTVVDGTLNLATTGVLDLEAGRLEGAGTIIGNVVAGAATIAPGHSPGKLTFNQALALDGASTLQIDADGLTQGSSYDWLAVGGNVALAGHVVLDIGYHAQIGDRFTFLTFGHTRNGQFADVTAGGYTLDLVYGSNDVTAVVTGISAVPEPGAWALFLGGGIALAGIRRRRTPALRSA